MGRNLVCSLTVALCLAVAATAADSPTTVRVFNLHFTSAAEASSAVQPLLSENGSLTVHPGKSILTVQDTPEVVARVADVIARLESPPKRFQIAVELLEGTRKPLAANARVEVDRRVTRMFPFSSYRSIGSALIEGEVGSAATADIGEGHRLSFVVAPVRVSKKSAFGIPDVGARIQLGEFTLEKVTAGRTGAGTAVEIIRTDVYLSPDQEVIIGAGGSEDSPSGLVLILRSERAEEQ
jgi:hypothetical protein